VSEVLKSVRSSDIKRPNSVKRDLVVETNVSALIHHMKVTVYIVLLRMHSTFENAFHVLYTYVYIVYT